MTLDLESRRSIAALKREIKALTGPDRAEQRKVRKANSERRKAALVRTPEQRQPRVRDNGYLQFLRRQPCLNCRTTPCDAAHIRFVPPGSGWRHVGKAEKPDDARAVSLCRACHTLQHSMSEAVFWSSVLRLDPVEAVAEMRRLYEGQGFDGTVRPRVGS